MWAWQVKMATQNLLKFTQHCIVYNPIIGYAISFKPEIVKAVLDASFPYNLFVTRCWCLDEILKLMLGRDSEDDIWSWFVIELVIWPIRLLWLDELNPQVRCAFGNVYTYGARGAGIKTSMYYVFLLWMASRDNAMFHLSWQYKWLIVIKGADGRPSKIVL